MCDYRSLLFEEGVDGPSRQVGGFLLSCRLLGDSVPSTPGSLSLLTFRSPDRPDTDKGSTPTVPTGRRP